MSDYVEVTRQGLGGRGKDSLGGAFFGFILVLAGTVLLFWNEGRAVKRYLALKEGAGAVVSTSADPINPSTEGKLVHLSGETKTNEPIGDADFGISASGIRLDRHSEMYQWIEEVRSETKEKVGGGTETVKRYSYTRAWRDRPVDSSQFKVPGGHQNPKTMLFGSASVTAAKVTLGAFTLPDFLVSRIGGGGPLAVESLDQASAEVKSQGKLSGGGVYFGSNPEAPEVGDLRVKFSLVPTGIVSIVAQQSGSTFVPYQAKSGAVELLELGSVSASDMFQMAQDRNKMLTWALRIGGFILLMVAFSMILRPLAVLASVLPFLGRLARTGIGIVSFLLAAVVATFTISVAWIFYRPILGITILALGIMVLVMLVKRSKKAPAALAPPLPGTPPPLT